MTVDLVGHAFNQAGTLISGATVDIFTVATGAIETTPSDSATVSTTTGADTGLWDEFNIEAGTYDVRIKSGSEVRWLRGEDQIQIAKLEATTMLKVIDAIDMMFGTAEDAAIRWSTGDASNHALSVGLGNSNQALHITDLAAIATDWNISATTHPNVYIHSNTTPATDYLRLGDHDGTTAYIDVVGGTTLAFEVDGNTEVTIAATGLTLPAGSDLLFSGTTGTNDINLTDSVDDALSIVRGSTDMVVFDSNTPRITFTPATTFVGTITGPSGTWDSGGMDIAASDTYAISGTDVLNATTLGSGVTASSLVSLGTITSDIQLDADLDFIGSQQITTSAGTLQLNPSGTSNGGVIESMKNNGAGGVIHACFTDNNISDNSATDIFRISTTDESGNADGGGMSVLVHAIVGHDLDDVSSNNSAKGFIAHAAISIKNNGADLVTAVTEISETAETASGDRQIGTVTMAIDTGTARQFDFSFLLDLTGSPVTEGHVTVWVEVVWHEFLTAPTLTAL